MSSLVSVDCKSGQLHRYEAGGSEKRLTHKATPIEGPDALSPQLVENFRLYPPAEFRVEPPQGPSLPPAAVMAKSNAQDI